MPHDRFTFTYTIGRHTDTHTRHTLTRTGTREARHAHGARTPRGSGVGVRACNVIVQLEPKFVAWFLNYGFERLLTEAEILS